MTSTDKNSTVGIMVAPNGARLTVQDHPAIPVTVPAVIETVRASMLAGAHAVHLHVRDEKQKHILDTGAYREAIDELTLALGPDFPIQVTTEAVGVYSQEQQIELVKSLRPDFVSVALAEMAGPEQDISSATDFYHFAIEHQIAVQHILYSADDLNRFLALQNQGVIPKTHRSVLFVLGRYTVNQQSSVEDLMPFLNVLEEADTEQKLIWMICAFGQGETSCLLEAARQGGHCRIGFENNRLHADGRIAASNQERVAALCDALNAESIALAQMQTIAEILGAA